MISKSMTIGRIVMAIGLTMFCAAGADAQPAADVSGHWDGAVQTPNADIPLALDLANADGKVGGTLTAPGVTNLPLTDIAVNGKTVRFHVRTDQDFSGTLSADGKTIEGSAAIGTFSLPFTLTKAGPARIETPVKTPSIGKQFEGRWDGMLTLSGLQFRLRLQLANNPDGTSTGTVVNLDQGGLTLPVTSIMEDGSMLTLGFKAVDATYTATLTDDQMELIGTYTQGQAVQVTFLRAAGK